MPDLLLVLAARLRALRIERGLTQDQLGERAGMDPAEIRRLESGRRDPGVRVLSRLAQGLEVPASSLLDESDSAETE